MEAKERREQIISLLKCTGQPLTGTALAKELGVSRQVIVGDVAILRASGIEIYATPQGYVILPTTARDTVTARFACHHSAERMEEELAAIVDNGGRVLDVSVEHPVYGEIKANLMLASRRDLAEFLHKSAKSGATPLSVVTGGVHLHTVEAPSIEVLHKIAAELKMLGILLD
ncbi:transcription repressor NadR [Sporomusa sp.]|uniref:transcription repressor NadR n=1 Tax=Sporomusa sp. TaxID=2078658 RepID=UPI002BE01789|nr:transcription repressor NadR [Sporomusa sp.]HWR45762.1 transcription repressor NadR [Sporomusa sp.]